MVRKSRDADDRMEEMKAKLAAEDSEGVLKAAAQRAEVKASAGKGAKVETPKKAPKKEIRYTVILDEKTAKALEDEVFRQRTRGGPEGEGRKGFSKSEFIREAVKAHLSKS